MPCEQSDRVGIEESVRIDDYDDLCVREMYPVIDGFAFPTVLFCDDPYPGISCECASCGLVGTVF